MPEFDHYRSVVVKKSQLNATLLKKILKATTEGVSHNPDVYIMVRVNDTPLAETDFNNIIQRTIQSTLVPDIQYVESTGKSRPPGGNTL